MLAAYRESYGPPSVIAMRKLGTPAPGPGDILVRVKAATVSRTDCGILTGQPAIIQLFTGIGKPRLQITGSDFAGEVVAAGDRVTGWSAGDRVFGFNDNGLGSHAGYMCIKAGRQVARIPASVSYANAAASIEGMHYAINFLRRVKIAPGMQVMVNGGSGAIGSAMIQLLKKSGATIVATAPPDCLQKVADLGAGLVLDYTREDFTRLPMQFPYVLDAVGKSSFGACQRILTDNGIYISSELGPQGENPWLALKSYLQKGKRVNFPFPKDIPNSLQIISSMLDEGSLRPMIDRTYPLSEVAEAFTYVMEGQKRGNVVVLMDEAG